MPLGLCSVLEATGRLSPTGIWTAIVLGHITRASLSVARFRQGKWRSIRVPGRRPAPVRGGATPDPAERR